MQPIEVPSLPTNNPTYSQAMRLGDFIFVSGQLGVDPVTREIVTGGIEEETRQAIENIATVLAAAGSSLDRVVKVSVFVTDFSLLPRVNSVYGPRFPHRPAKTGLEISRLDKGALIEIEVIAAA
jgi:2-iminobutanoate/2-iminopropanoate deaminase